MKAVISDEDNTSSFTTYCGQRATVLKITPVMI